MSADTQVDAGVNLAELEKMMRGRGAVWCAAFGPKSGYIMTVEDVAAIVAHFRHWRPLDVIVWPPGASTLQVAVAPGAAAGPYPTAMRPATAEEASRITNICLPNGVMVDGGGNPRTLRKRIRYDGSWLVCNPNEVAEYLGPELDAMRDRCTIEDVYLSDVEFEALPEFEGF